MRAQIKSTGFMRLRTYCDWKPYKGLRKPCSVARRQSPKEPIRVLMFRVYTDVLRRRMASIR